MEVITISADLSQIIAGGAVFLYSIYLFLLGAFQRFRIEMNEILGEIFDASMTEEEKINLGPCIIIPVLMCLLLLGIIFLILNLKGILIPLVFFVFAALFTAFKRRNEISRKELADLGRVDL